MVFVARGMETALSWAIEQSGYPTLVRCMIYGIACVLVAGQGIEGLEVCAIPGLQIEDDVTVVELHVL